MYKSFLQSRFQLLPNICSQLAKTFFSIFIFISNYSPCLFEYFVCRILLIWKILRLLFYTSEIK